MHYWGSNFMVAVMTLHMVQVFVFGAYKYPRELNWMIGVGLLILTLGMGFTGYLLPWNQKAYWATTVGTSIAGTVPWVGPIIEKSLRGGPDLSALTLSRFFSAHIWILPALKSGGPSSPLIYGAMFGFLTYATYDLTNHATLRNWTWQITLLDIAWGSFAAAMAAVVAFAIVTFPIVRTYASDISLWHIALLGLTSPYDESRENHRESILVYRAYTGGHRNRLSFYLGAGNVVQRTHRSDRFRPAAIHSTTSNLCQLSKGLADAADGEFLLKQHCCNGKQRSPERRGRRTGSVSVRKNEIPRA